MGDGSVRFIKQTINPADLHRPRHPGRRRGHQRRQLLSGGDPSDLSPGPRRPHRRLGPHPSLPRCESPSEIDHVDSPPAGIDRPGHADRRDRRPPGSGSQPAAAWRSRPPPTPDGARPPEAIDGDRLHLAHRNRQPPSPRPPNPSPTASRSRVPWAAREGRLRLLDRDGRLFELTWGRRLPDGSTLVDVMSPSVSLDGGRILFAGRKGEHDRWRIYEVRVDGSGLKPLTGGPGGPRVHRRPAAPVPGRRVAALRPGAAASSTTTTSTPPTSGRTGSPSPRADCPTWAATTADGPPRSGPGPPAPGPPNR